MEIPIFKVKKFPSMVEPHCYLNLVIIISDIVAIGETVEWNKSINKSVVSIEIYSKKKKKLGLIGFWKWRTV